MTLSWAPASVRVPLVVSMAALSGSHRSIRRTPVTVSASIRDQGRGIAPDDLEKVKQKFFKAKNSVRGSGIGLAVVDEIVGTLGGIARWQKQKWLRIACIATLLLTSFSRMYLGVHTPLDVGVSFAVAVVLVFALYPIVRYAVQKPKRMYVLLGVMTAISLAFVLYANLAAFPADIDAENLAHGQKNSYSLLGALLGFCLAYGIERKYIRFETKAVWWAQILKVVLGLAVVLAVKEGLKLVFSALGFTWLGTNAIRYFAVVLMAATVWPLTFRFFARLGKKKQ